LQGMPSGPARDQGVWCPFRHPPEAGSRMAGFRVGIWESTR